MRLQINDLKKGTLFMMEGEPYIMLSAKHLHMGRGGAHIQTKIRNLKNGKIFDRNFKSADSFEEADIRKTQAVFVYRKGDEHWFHERGIPAERFSLRGEIIGNKADLLQPSMR